MGIDSINHGAVMKLGKATIVYVHSASPYFTVKKWLAGIVRLLKNKKKKKENQPANYFLFSVWAEVTVTLSAADIDQNGH